MKKSTCTLYERETRVLGNLCSIPSGEEPLRRGEKHPMGKDLHSGRTKVDYLSGDGVTRKGHGARNLEKPPSYGCGKSNAICGYRTK